MRRRTAAGLVVGALLLAAPQAGAAVRKTTQPPAPREPVIAVIDSGLRATHQEFDYRGPTSTSDQIVAWWDFTTEVKTELTLPAPGELWDTAVREPYDKHGHGTGTAAMAVGRNRVAPKTPSALPGAKLAIAKVANADGIAHGDIGKAVAWAAETVKADVINISIASIVPLPAWIEPAYAAIERARRLGVLVVVSNGNGWGNLGVVPGDPGWASEYSASTAALTVGAAGATGYLQSTDPEVAAAYTVLSASNQSDAAYAEWSGTSFAAPFVAGFAATLLREAWAGGRTLTPDALERLVKYSAKDTSTPPTFEGYGTLSLAELTAARKHAWAGTLPARPSPDLSGLYVEQVAGTLRSAWSG